MQENQELIREIDYLLYNPVTKEQIETKLVNSRSNSVNSHNGSHISVQQSIAYNQSIPSLASLPGAINRSVPSVLQSPPLYVYESVVHQQYSTPHSLDESPQHPYAQASRQTELEQLHREIQMLTQRQSVQRSYNNTAGLRNAPVYEPAVDLAAPQISAPPLLPKDASFRSQQDTSFSTQYISELERENARIKRYFILKDIYRLKYLAQYEMFSREELEYVIDKSIYQFCKQ